MPYATLTDLTEAFGESEAIRLTAPEGELDGPVVEAKVTRALTDASDLIDSYLGRRYAVPLTAPIAPAITRACLVLGRFDLAHGDQREPTEQMRLARKETIAWLERLATGEAVLPGNPPLAGASGAGARVSDRDRAFSTDNLAGW
jgi:phage gp36-like protein